MTVRHRKRHIVEGVRTREKAASGKAFYRVDTYRRKMIIADICCSLWCAVMSLMTLQTVENVAVLLRQREE